MQLIIKKNKFQIINCYWQGFAYPGPGPPFIRSNTCAGFSNCLNLLRNLTP